eukprot:1017764-Rhodomonas_salina.2
MDHEGIQPRLGTQQGLPLSPIFFLLLFRSSILNTSVAPSFLGMPFQTLLSSTVFPADDSLQVHLRNMTAQMAHAMDPPTPSRAGNVPLRLGTRTADINAALALY